MTNAERHSESALLFRSRWPEHLGSYLADRKVTEVPRAMLPLLVAELRYSIALELGKSDQLTEHEQRRGELYDEYRRAHGIPHASDMLMRTGNPYV